MSVTCRHDFFCCCYDYLQLRHVFLVVGGGRDQTPEKKDANGGQVEAGRGQESRRGGCVPMHLDQIWPSVVGIFSHQIQIQLHTTTTTCTRFKCTGFTLFLRFRTALDHLRGCSSKIWLYSRPPATSSCSGLDWMTTEAVCGKSCSLLSWRDR